MTIFEHLSVFISIILGLAVVHLLGGISLILDKRTAARTYGVHLMWTLNLLLVTVLMWLGNFALTAAPNVGVWHFLNLLAYAMAVYLMSGLLYPVRGPEVTDFREHFHANRARFCALGILFVVFDALDGVLEHYATGLAWNPFQFGTLAVFLGIFLIGMRTEGERFHRFAVGLFFLGLLGWLQSLVAAGVVAG